MAKYTYSTIDTLNNKVNASKLQLEISKSSITIAVDYLEINGSVLDVYMKADLSVNEQTILTSTVSLHDGEESYLTPEDIDKAPYVRTKVTNLGWAYQLHHIEFTTSTLDGFYNKTINPVTFVETDLGFTSVKLYKEDGTLITDQIIANTECTTTVIDWMVNFDMEVIGCYLSQDMAPTDDIRLWVVSAPGIANIIFGEGGINLKCVSKGSLFADGRASKFLSATLPIPGVNKFRTILKHSAGTKHTAMILFNIYKS